MGTEVLRPQDCLIQRIRVSSPGGLFSRRRNHYGSNNPNSNYNYNYNISHHQNNINSNVRTTNRKPAVRHERPDQRRHQRAQSEPSVSRRSVYDDNSSAKRSSSDDMMKVSILRRGESLDSKIKSGRSADAGRVSPAAMYAGSGFAVSPAPSSLPLPSFSKKKQTSIDDSATRDIKRLVTYREFRNLDSSQGAEQVHKQGKVAGRS